jgi:hypothetical protein
VSVVIGVAGLLGAKEQIDASIADARGRLARLAGVLSPTHLRGNDDLSAAIREVCLAGEGYALAHFDGYLLDAEWFSSGLQEGASTFSAATAIHVETMRSIAAQSAEVRHGTTATT